jgi:hypothetical protein
MLDELAESYGHFKEAAGHVAGGAAEKITPRYDLARDVAVRGWMGAMGAFSPLVDQMREGAANARRQYEEPGRNRWPMLVGLLAAGAAVGAAGAMIVRRRRAAAQWDEYEPVSPMGEAPYETPSKPSAAAKVSSGAATVAESVSTRAGKLAESLHGKSARSPESGATSGSTAGSSSAPESSASTSTSAGTQTPSPAASKNSDRPA